MKSLLDFQVIFTTDEDGVYVADCPAIPGCHSQGKTLEEAEAHILEAIKLCLLVAEDDPEYRSTIVFPTSKIKPFVGIRDISVQAPSFL